MTRSILYLVGGASALALVMASACTVTDATDDDGTGGSGNTTTSPSSSSAGGSTSSAGGSTSSTGGAGDCVGCSVYLTDQTGTITEDQLCGFVPPDMCDLDTSCAFLVELSLCTCGDGAGMAGACEAECELTCTGSGEDTTCQACVEAGCTGQLNECLADTTGTGG